MIGRRSRPKSQAYAYVEAWLPAYVNEHGELPTYATVQQFLRTEHQLGSSSSTVQRSLNGWLAVSANQQLLEAARQSVRAKLKGTGGTATGAAIEASDDAAPGLPSTGSADPLLASALTVLRERIREEESQRIQKAADARIEQLQAAADEAVRNAKLGEERAALLLQQAEKSRIDAEARMLAAESACATRVSDAQSGIDRIMRAHAEERSAARDDAARETQRQVEEACSRLKNQLGAQEEQLARLRAENASLSRRIEELQSQLLSSESNAAAQHSEITRHWAGELSRSREETKAAQAALLKAVAEKEDAVRTARIEATEGIGKALNDLRDAVGGVNTVHNTHLGTITKRLEALASAIVSDAGRKQQATQKLKKPPGSKAPAS